MQRYRLYFSLKSIVMAVVGVPLLLASSAHAVSSDQKMFVSADNTFYAYVKGGETLSASFVKNTQVDPSGVEKQDVTVTLDGPGVDTKTCVIPKAVSVGSGCSFADVAAPQTGIYRVAVSLPSSAKPYTEVSPTVKWGGNIFDWNIVVKDGQTEQKGRVWSELFAVRQPAPESFSATVGYYYVSESGYVYRATYGGYNGQISTFSADSVGIRKGKECTSAYQSVEVADPAYSPSFGSCGGSYKLFFEQPAGDLPQTALRWDGKQRDWVAPDVVSPKVSDLAFVSDKSGDAQSGKVTFKLSNFVGQYSVDIDTTGDGGFTSKEDVHIKRTIKKLTDQTQEVRFDGVDARGQVVPPSQQISIRINVEKVAEIHLVNADVEGRSDGLELVRVNGENAPSARMCWNDTNLAMLPDVTLQTKGIDGRDCPDSSTAKLHGWPYATGSWGDSRYIDDWAYATTSLQGVPVIKYPDSLEPVVSAKQRNGQVLMAIGALVLTTVFGGLIVAIIIKRRRHAALARAARQVEQPVDYPGPGDPRPPGV